MEADDLDEIDKMGKMKITILGKSGVGKTCIINRYTSNYFDQVKSTKAAYFKSRSLNTPDGTINIRQIIWDTAGQETYRSLASLYYKDANAVILVYDITDRKSFEDLSYWLSELNQHGSKNVLITIAGNKADIINEEKVSLTEAKEYAQKAGAEFFLVSAKEDFNVTEMFTDLAMRNYSKFKSRFGFETNPKRVNVEKNGSQDKKKKKLESKQNRKERNCC